MYITLKPIRLFFYLWYLSLHPPHAKKKIVMNTNTNIDIFRIWVSVIMIRIYDIYIYLLFTVEILLYIFYISVIFRYYNLYLIALGMIIIL